jgi:hypothetical protein
MPDCLACLRLYAAARQAWFASLQIPAMPTGWQASLRARREAEQALAELKAWRAEFGRYRGS